jgi:hypothetical protein
VGQIVLPDEESLLLIILDDLRRADLRVVRVEPDIAKGTSLAQEVPALIQFDLDLRKPLPIGLGKFPLLIQSLFFFDKALNISEDGLIPTLILHESLLSRGYDRNSTILCYAPPKLRSTAALADIMMYPLSLMLFRPAVVRFCRQKA